MKALLLTLALVGCGDAGQSVFSASKPPEIVYPNFRFHIREAPEELPANTNGTAVLFGDADNRVCAITLREYPKCLLHEIRHCTEGDWHPADVPNSEDC